MEELELYLPKDICKYVVDPYLKEYPFLSELKELMKVAESRDRFGFLGFMTEFLLEQSIPRSNRETINSWEPCDCWFNQQLRKNINSYWKNKT